MLGGLFMEEDKNRTKRKVRGPTLTCKVSSWKDKKASRTKGTTGELCCGLTGLVVL